MKKTAPCFKLAAVVVGVVWSLGGCATSDPATTTSDAGTKGTPRVHVVFANPEKFTDARSSLGGGADPRNLDPLGEFLVREASQQLRPGERLAVVFYDVDLAGDFEPGRLSPTGDIRVVREVYPPRLVFSYTILDQTDTVVAEGKVTLTNSTFMRELRSPLERDEPLVHEKRLLRDWVKQTLAARKGAPAAPASAGDEDTQ